MSARLSSHLTWVTPHLYPRMRQTGHAFLAAFADVLYEYTDSPAQAGTRGVAKSIADIHPSRFAIERDRAWLCWMMPGYTNPATDTDPNGTPRFDAFNQGAAEARRWGALRSFYRRGASMHTHVLVPPVEAAVARAVSLRDVREHLRRHPVEKVVIEGVDVGAKKVGGAWEVTREVLEPQTPEAAASAIARKVDVGYVGRIKAGDLHPEWLPTGFEAAKLIRETAGQLTGAEVATTPAPRVAYEHQRVVVTDELAELVPALRPLRKQRPVDGPEAAVFDGWELGQVEPEPAPEPARRKSGKSEPEPLVFDDAALALLRSA